MDKKPSSFRDVIELWPQRKALADSLNRVHQPDIPASSVRNWYRRNDIPPGWWHHVVDAAKACGFSLTYADLRAIEAATAQPPQPALSETP